MKDESVVECYFHPVVKCCLILLPCSGVSMGHETDQVLYRGEVVQGRYPLRPAASHIWCAQEPQSTA